MFETTLIPGVTHGLTLAGPPVRTQSSRSYLTAGTIRRTAIVPDTRRMPGGGVTATTVIWAFIIV